MLAFTTLLLSASLAWALPQVPDSSYAVSSKRALMMQLMEEDYATIPRPENLQAVVNGAAPCVNGVAAGYPCKDIDLMSFLPHKNMGSQTREGNDIWGWTDPETGREYAIVGQTDGTAFVDITEPTAPVYLGRTNTKTSNSIWRDIKVYKNHAFIVAESWRHGVQVFDLTQLRRDVNAPVVPKVWQEHAYFPKTGRCHNIVINEETGYAYCVGSNDVCRGGLYMIDIRNPMQPTYAGCFADDGYVHDAQCVVYNGPDTRFRGNEVCFCYNEDTLTIVDVTDKTKPKMLSKTPYDTSAYTHQGWLTPDQTYLLLDDELDERERVGPAAQGNTLTYIWKLMDLEQPEYLAVYKANVTSIDHNLYIRNNKAYLTNYASGLRVLDLSQISTGALKETAFFDVRPEDNKVIFQGSWSSYPYFASGNVIVNSIERGLFVVKPQFEM